MANLKVLVNPSPENRRRDRDQARVWFFTYLHDPYRSDVPALFHTVTANECEDRSKYRDVTRFHQMIVWVSVVCGSALWRRRSGSDCRLDSGTDPRSMRSSAAVFCQDANWADSRALAPVFWRDQSRVWTVSFWHRQRFHNESTRTSREET